MPLLRGKPLKEHKYLKKFSDDQEVFYCELTNEIFEDYEEYCERVISCNCMIWTCAITGKTELTYQEALDSEDKALKNIKDFAPELRTPVLYIASLTAAPHFSEMADAVFNFVRNRYFVGESVQASFDNDNWSYAQVLSVILPTPEEVMAYSENNGLAHPIHHRPYPAELYKYEVEELLDEEDDDSEPMVVRVMVLPGEQVRRMKSLYTKEKNRAYLKQFTEQRKSGNWRVKSAIMAKYGITTIDFKDIFIGEPPIFVKETPAVHTSSSKNGEYKQQSMKKFLMSKMSPSKNALIDKAHDKSKSNNKLSDKKKSAKKSISRDVAKKIQKKYAASIDRVATNQDAVKEEMKRKKIEMVRKQKEAKKQEKEKLERFAKEWQKKREDLVCEDLKELPVPCPIDCRLPNNLFGEFAMILEFFTCFGKILKLTDYFPYGLSFELLERALVDVEVAGPFSDILQLLLSAIFVFQDDEDAEVRQRASSGDISLKETPELSAQEAMEAATLAARWSRTYHNVPLNKLHMDAITVTDILRLHLLSSGGRAGEQNAKWRLQERGGYLSTDDPGLEFRRKEPQILKFLSSNSVAALPIIDKLKVVSCLMNQILSYASMRDVMDERYEKVSLGKKEIRLEQASEAKKEKERLKKRKEALEKGEAVSANAEEKKQRAVDSARRYGDLQRRLVELRDVAMGYQVLPLGQDRAHRRFWVFSGLSGLFVEDDERWPGHCLPVPTVTSAPAAADEDDTMSYIRKLFEAGRNSTGSDKENEGEGNQMVASPKKKHLGESNGVSLPSPASSEHKSPIKVDVNRALVCTANEETCSIHNPSIDRTKWLFYYKEDEVDELIKNLNKRGYRECALRETLATEKGRILKHLAKCPVQKLNRFVPFIPSAHVNKVIGTRSIKGYENANLKFPAGTPVDEVLERYLRDVILDTEEKIFGGGLGCLKVSNRKSWREDIESGNYNSQDSDLAWPTKMTVQHPKKDDDDSPSRPGTPCSEHSHNESNEEPAKPVQSPAVRDLAMAVLQLARSLEPKYLQKPLPFEEKRPIKLNAMERWELSLMHSTSFSQVYLHHATLENSIQWNKSVLNAKCKICRRGKDDVNMLLCDGCNRGFHLYCLKPKLTKIPKGDWFCPDCRPLEKTPVQRSSRRRYLQDEEEEPDDTDDEPLVKTRDVRKRKRADESWEESSRPKRTR